eukprot:COSAG01_NODE_7111_length_3346_cov_78.626116_4_plen_36_part_00
MTGPVTQHANDWAGDAVRWLVVHFLQRTFKYTLYI